MLLNVIAPNAGLCLNESMESCYDLIIVGGGPAGISAAYAAKQHGLDYIVLERAELANTVYQYPLGKVLFSTSNELEFEPQTLHPKGVKPTREELLAYYQSFEQQHQLKIQRPEAVISITPAPSGILSVTSERTTYQARNVLIAVGGMGLVNRLGVPGDTPERVSYFFHSAAPLVGKVVVVIGIGNSAAETALELCQAGIRPTIIVWRPSLDKTEYSQGSALKPWVREPLEAAIAEGKITAIFESQVVEILSQTIKIKHQGEYREIPAEVILALTGAKPDLSLLKTAGAVIANDGRPVYDSHTYETSVKHLYVCGHLTRELHMKMAISLPPTIVAGIAAQLKSSTTKLSI